VLAAVAPVERDVAERTAEAEVTREERGRFVAPVGVLAPRHARRVLEADEAGVADEDVVRADDR
jgi:hypothetical protein